MFNFVLCAFLKIGVVLPLSGVFSDYGKDCLYGMKLAVAETEVCSLIVEDNQGDKSNTVDAIKKLVSQGVCIIVGPIISENALAAAYLIDSLNVPLILPATTHPIVTKISPLVFRLCYTDNFQAKIMAEFTYFSMKKRHPALFIDNSSVYSIELADVFQKEIEKLGATIVSTKVYTSEETDFRAALSKIAEAGADCIFIPGYYNQVSSIIKQARGLGINIPLLGCDGWDSQSLLVLAGDEKGISLYCTHFFSKCPEVRGFRNNYLNKYVAEPTSFSALGYDAIKLISSLTLENPETETILNELNQVKRFTGVTGDIDFSESRNPVKSATIIRMERGVLSLEQKITLH